MPFSKPSCLGRALREMFQWPAAITNSVQPSKSNLVPSLQLGSFHGRSLFHLVPLTFTPYACLRGMQSCENRLDPCCVGLSSILDFQIGHLLTLIKLISKFQCQFVTTTAQQSSHFFSLISTYRTSFQ